MAQPRTQLSHHEYIIILDPSGDGQKTTGRAIDNSFERALTLQCAEKIKLLLESYNPKLTIIISRSPGDHVYELQNATLANRLDVDLFLNLNFYHTADTKPTLFLYQFSYGNDFIQVQPGLQFSPYDQAYKINKSTTDKLIESFKTHLSQQCYNSLFFVAGPHALPIKPLIGIVSPAIAIEVGLKNKDAWQQLVEPLALGIIEMINYLNTT